jgi:hypothetical protein
MPAQIWSPEGECRTYEKLSTGLTSSVGFTAAKLLYKGNIARSVLITVETAAVRFTMDGTAAVVTATAGGTGHLLDIGQSFIVRGQESIRNFRAINAVASTGSVIFCSFYF